MQSSNSGFQRLSQAALSRSHFLRLAAGALFPAVGWRLPAAAAANPQLAQNGGATETKDAAAGRMGAILVSQFGSVKIHSYLSPADGLQVNTQMIEGPNAVVIFDGQLLLPYADEVASYVQALGKPVDRIILSHAHTDHWGGLQVLTERFPGARVFALDGIADQVRTRGPARLDGLRRTHGDKAATKVTVPTETITEGPQRIDGITYDFRAVRRRRIRFAARCCAARAKSADGIRPGVFTEPTCLHRGKSFRSLVDSFSSRSRHFKATTRSSSDMASRTTARRSIAR